MTRQPQPQNQTPKSPASYWIGIGTTRTVRNREKYEQRSRENFREFFKRHDPFGNFGERDDPLDEEYEEYDEDYPFGVFGLKKSSSEEDVRKAYRKAARETHPKDFDDRLE